MSQHDYVIDNAPGASVRVDLNAVLQAIATLNAGASEPATTYANMLWYDTANSLLKKRTNANDGWDVVPFGLASQAEAEAGTDNAKYLSALRVSQAIAALAPVRATNTVTLTNKRVTERVGTVTSHATPTINTDNVDVFTITALAAAITSMTTNLSGTPTAGQKLIIRIKDNGTARAIAWGASFASRGGTLPTTTVLGKTHYVGFIWNEVASVWDCVVAVVEA